MKFLKVVVCNTESYTKLFITLTNIPCLVNHWCKLCEKVTCMERQEMCATYLCRRRSILLDFVPLRALTLKERMQRYFLCLFFKGLHTFKNVFYEHSPQNLLCLNLYIGVLESSLFD